MCGRYGLKVNFGTLAKLLKAEPVDDSEWGPDFNIAPTDRAPVVVATAAGPTLQLFRWGLVPFWAKSPREGAKMINARSETLAQKPAFREALTTRRALVPASGWFEWVHPTPTREGEPAPKPEPHWLHPVLPDQLVLFGGLWAKWKEPTTGETLKTFSIITTDAAPSTRAIHDRMPLILDADAQASWLDPATPGEALQALLVPYTGPLAHHRVSQAVNSVRADGPELIAPIGPALEQGKLAF